MKYLFAVNPVSGKGKAKLRMHELAVNLKAHNYDFMIYETKPNHYGEELKQIISQNHITHVFAVGGDGTAHEVLNAIVSLDVFFGVIPFGSGNDFARVLKLPQKIEKVFEMIENNHSMTIDVGKIQDRYFLNYVSFGFDVSILINSLKYKRFLHSGLAYAIAVVTTLITFKCKPIRINDVEDKLYLSTIHNGKFYGGGMKINPFSEINDGIFNLCTVKKMPRIKLLVLFPSVFSGKHYKFKKLVKFECKRQFTIDSADHELKTGVDGEIYTFTTPIDVQIIPESVKMIIN